jgi:hypothetical protein
MFAHLAGMQLQCLLILPACGFNVFSSCLHAALMFAHLASMQL